MRQGTNTDLGKVRVHKKVIASIASIATVEVEGVARIGGDIKTGIYDLLGRKNSPGAIGVDFDDNGEALVTVPIIVKYGFNLPDVAAKVQENIKASIEKMTDAVIKDIDVNIQEVEKG
ncbi:MAG: Asp23/Gls24 family envelope stress response protein [Candidatus Omnitrophota bacterium]